MILAIVQARVSSTRYPEKVLEPILGKPMLAHQLDRLGYSKLISKIIVATSVNVEDTAIVDLCNQLSIAVFRGSLDDVLDRFYKAAAIYSPGHVVRVTGDCPLIDSHVVDMLINYHLENKYDYSSNTLEPTWPDGLDCEVMKFDVLKQAWNKSKLISEREHVTPYIYKHPELFSLGSLKSDVDLSYMRWTVDEAEDMKLVKYIYENLYTKNEKFSTSDVIDLLKKNSGMSDINSRYVRNEGYEKSLKQDGEI